MTEVMSAPRPTAATERPETDGTAPEPTSGGSTTGITAGIVEGMPRTLAALLAEATTAHPAVTLLDGGADAVVLARRDNIADVLLADGVMRVEHVDRLATPITDPARETELLRRAVTRLTDQPRTERAAADAQRRDHARTLRRIRDYAVARHKDGDICRDGLNRFLDHFDLDRYEPTVRVRFTITGSYLVRTTSEGDAERDGRGYLGIDLSRVDDVVDASENFDVEIDGTEELDDDE